MKKLIFTISLIIIILNLLTSQSVLPQVTQDWVSRYNGPGNSKDYANASAADNSGNFYVTGYSEDRGGNKDYVTIKYNSSGIQQWLARYNAPGDDWDVANKIAIDESGNVYVTGMSAKNVTGDYATIKYSPAGIQQWVSRYTSTGGLSDENATAIAVDGSGNVYVTGHSSGDYATIKYNSSGDSLWGQKIWRTGIFNRLCKFNLC
ncbi:MAG: SBBP repeat-containing protein [Ignavibacteria bacterium]|nr:SBBP repeat-containing protein [Ignavibacteria bacterium]